MQIKPLKQPEPKVGNIYIIDTIDKFNANNYYRFKGEVKLIRITGPDFQLEVINGGFIKGHYQYPTFYWNITTFLEFKKKHYIKYKSNVCV